MNRYQKQRSKEIKQMLRDDEFGFMSYSQAKRYWNWLHRYLPFSPCDRCCNDKCEREAKSPIVYCPSILTPNMKLVRALMSLPQGMK